MERQRARLRRAPPGSCPGALREVLTLCVSLLTVAASDVRGTCRARDHPRERQPAPRSEPGGSGDPGAHLGRGPAVRLRAGRADAGRRGRHRRGRPPRALAHPPPQRPRHRPQRPHHHAVGDGDGAAAAAHHRAGRHRRTGAPHRGDARDRHRLPAGAPRGPDVAPRRPGHRGHRWGGVRRGGRADRRRRPPTTPPSTPPSATASRRAGVPSSSPATPCRARGSTPSAATPTCWCTRWSAPTSSS